MTGSFNEALDTLRNSVDELKAAIKHELRAPSWAGMPNWTLIEITYIVSVLLVIAFWVLR